MCHRKGFLEQVVNGWLASKEAMEAPLYSHASGFCLRTRGPEGERLEKPRFQRRGIGWWEAHAKAAEPPVNVPP